VADNWGYGRLFALLALVWIVQVSAGLLLPDTQTAVPNKTPATILPRRKFSQPFWLLLVANMLVTTSASVGIMGGSLRMNDQGISLTLITLLAAVQAGLGLVANPLAGRLSDKLNRKTVLTIAYGGRALGLVALLLATSPAGFWLMAVCFTIAFTKDAVSPALVTDIADDGQLDSHMAAFTAGNWSGHVIGFVLAGMAMQYLGASTTFLLAALLPLSAILVLAHLAEGVGEPAVVSA
jgi:MFS family permease